MSQQISPADKRNLLWNMIEPGDPYDIKKSLIAKVPGDAKIFMGDHLELVCLFQAAQIERLHQSLREYAVKFKEVQRIQLDRHSYEVQIKELMMINEDAKGAKDQINKLKQFIRKQGLEMDEVRKMNLINDQNLEKKYQEALRKLEALYTQNSNLKIQIQNLDNRLVANRTSHLKELQDLRQKLDSDRRLQIEREIGDLNNSFKIQRNKFEFEVRRLKEKIDSQTETNDRLKSNIQLLNQSIEGYEAKLKESVHVQTQLSEHDRKLRLLSKQLERLQLLLSEKSRENNDIQTSLQKKQIQNKQLQSKVQNLQEQISNNNSQLRDQQKKLNLLINADEKSKQYEEQLALLTQEVQRLNVLLRSKNSEISQIHNKLLQSEKEISTLRRQYKQIQTLLRESQEQKDRLQSKIDRNNEHKQAEIRELKNRLETTTLENQTKKRHHQLQLGQYEYKLKALLDEVDRLNGVLKNKLADLNLKDSNLAEHNSKIFKFESEISQLRRKLHQSSKLQDSLQNYKSQISKLKSQNERTQDLMQATISQLEVENQFQKKKIRETEGLTTKTNQIERTLFNLRVELETTNNDLESKNNQNSKLRMQLSDVRQVNIRLSQQVEGQKRKIKTDSMGLQNQNFQLRNRILSLAQQIQRLNGVLKNKLQQKKQQDQIIQKLNNQLQDFSLKQQNFKRVQSQLKLVISNNENQISSLTIDGDKNRRRIHQLETQNNSLRLESQQRIYTLSRNIEKLSKDLKNRQKEYQGLQQQYRIQLVQSSQRVLRDSNHRISALQDEIASLSSRLNRKSDELARLETEFREKELLLDRTKTQNVHLNNKMNELSNLRTAYEDSLNQITKLNVQNKEMQSKITLQGSAISKGNFYQEKLKSLQQEIDKLNNIIFSRDQQIEKLKRNQSLNLQKISRITLNHEEEIKILETRLRGQYSETLRRAQFIEEELRNNAYNSQELSAQLNKKDGQIYQWQTRCEEVQARLDNQSRTVTQLQRRVNLLLKQVERLNDVLQGKISEYKLLENQYHRLQQSQLDGDQKRQQWRNQLGKEIERLNNVLAIKIKELQMVTIQYRSLQEAYQIKGIQYEKLQTKISIMGEEIERLNKVLKETIDDREGAQIAEIQRLNNALRLKIIQSEEWQQQVNRSGEQLNKQYSELYAAHQQTLRENQNYKRRIAQYEEKFEKLLSEFSRLQNIIQTLKGQNDFLKQQNYNIKVKMNKYESLEEMNKRLNQEIQRLNKIKTELQEEIGDLRIRFVDQAALHKRINEHLTLFVVLFAQIESLRMRVKQKEKQVEEVRRSSLAFKI